MQPEINLSYGSATLSATSVVEVYHEGEGPRALPLQSLDPAGTRREFLASLADGMMHVEQGECDGLRVVRETFRHDPGRGMMAVRLLVTNAGAEAVGIATLTPVDIRGDGLRLGGIPAGEWTYIRQPRHKNDMPAAAVLGSETPGVWDAARGTPETGGAPKGSDAGWPTRFVSAELTLLRAGDAGALFGFFPLDRQFVQSVLELTPDRRNLARLRLDCQCDGQILPPGETLTSQWVFVKLSPDVLEAAEHYAETLLEEHPAAEAKDLDRQRPPTVWCSWYYYGDGFSQEEAEANLEALRQRPLPIDVFQIDECWDQVWGDWYPNVRWPDVARFAERVRAAGYRPGIWTCPLLADYRSTTRYHHPEWLLKKRNGERVIFPMGPHRSFVLDPTHPEVLAFLEDLFRRLTHAWGYTYHKLDFTRAVGDPDSIFHDRTRNRAQAYRMALEAVRRGAGKDAYINVCGGFYGPLIGLADAQRTGSDVKSEWPKAPAGEEAWGYGPFTIKQNTLRFWMNCLWDNDPDALMVRRRPRAYREETLSLGRMNDDEALTSALNQYLGGGIVCFTENLTEVDDDRLLLLRHCAPSLGCAAIPRDAVAGARFPALFDTGMYDLPSGLPAWHTLSLVNWHDEARTFRVAVEWAMLSHFAMNHEEFLVCAFNGRWVRRMRRGEVMEVGPIRGHACEVLKVQPWPGEQPCIVRTDGHFSMGGTEIAAWEPHAEGVRLQIAWPWPAPLEVVVAPPAGRRFAGGEADGTRVVRIEGPLAQPEDVELRYA